MCIDVDEYITVICILLFYIFGFVFMLRNNDAKCCHRYTCNTQQSGRSSKVVALFLLQTLVAIWYDFFKSMIQSKWNKSYMNQLWYIIVCKIQFLLPNLIAFISQKEKNVWSFDYHLLTCSVRKMVLICLMQNMDMCLLYKSHQIARLVSHLINHFSKWMCTV